MLIYGVRNTTTNYPECTTADYQSMSNTPKNSSLYQESFFDSLRQRHRFGDAMDESIHQPSQGERQLHNTGGLISFQEPGVSLPTQGRIMDGAPVNHSFMLPTSRLRAR